MKLSKNWKLALSALFVLFIALFIALIIGFNKYVLPEISNVEKYNPLIQKIVKKKTGLPIEITDPRGSISWDFGYVIDAKNVLLKNKDGSRFIYADAPRIKIFYPSLLFKKITVKEISGNNFYGDLKILESGEFNLIKLFSSSKFGMKFKFNFSNSKMEFTNYSIDFSDLKSQKGLVHLFTLNGKSFKINSFTKNKHIDLSAKGKMSYKQKVIPFAIDLKSKIPFNKNHCFASGELSAINLNDFLFYIKKVLPNVKNVSGNGDIKFKIRNNSDFDVIADLNNFSMSKNKVGLVYNFPKNVSFLGKGHIDDSYINISRFTTTGDDFKVSVKGNIHRAFKDAKIINLNITTAKGSNVRSILNLLSKEINVSDNLIKKIIDYNLQANIESNIDIKGKSSRPLVYGKVNISDLFLMDDKKSKPSNVKLAFSGKKLGINGKLYIGQHNNLSVKGHTLPIYGRKNNLKIKTSNLVDLELTQKKLLALRDIIGFKIKPVDEMKLKGYGNIDLHIHGKFKNTSINGLVDLKNASILYNKLSMPAIKTNGSLIFDGRKVIYDNLNGFINSSKVLAKGYTLFDSNSDVDIYLPKANLETVRKFIKTSPLLKETDNALKIVKTASGFGELKIKLLGPKNKIISNGEVTLNGADLLLDDLSEPAKQVFGNISYKRNEVTFNGVKGNLSDSPVEMTGQVKDSISELVIKSDKINTKSVLRLINTSKSLVEVKKALKDYSNPSGFMKGVIELSGNVKGKDLFKRGDFEVIKVKVSHSDISDPFIATSGKFSITPDRFNTDELNGHIFDSNTTIKGEVTGLKSKTDKDIKQNLSIKVHGFEMTQLQRFLKSDVVKNEVKEALSVYQDTDGKIDAFIEFKPDDEVVTIDFDNASGIYKPTRAKVSIKEGQLKFNKQDMYFNNLSTNISSSYFYINGHIKKYATDPRYDIFLNSYTDAKDFNTKIVPAFGLPIAATGKIPFNVVFKGHGKEWKIRSQINLDLDSNIFYKGADLGEKSIRIISLDAQGTDEKIEINKFNIATPFSELPGNKNKKLNSEDAQKLETVLEIKGKVLDLKSNNPLFKNFAVYAHRPINISIINAFIRESQANNPFFTSGKFLGKIFIEGKTNSPNVNGSFYLKNIAIPSKQTYIMFADIDFNENIIILRDSHLAIADSSIRVGAILDNTLDIPMVVKRMEINSPSLNIDRIANAYKKKSTYKNKTTVGAELPLFTIEEGKIYAKELIVNDLITSDFFSEFSLTPDWALSMPGFRLKAANGNATGDLTYNLNSNVLNADISIKDMKANAAATTLLNMPNEVYGRVNGNVKINTKGTIQEEIISNANGSADFTINNGRLIRLGSVEYLLRLGNLLKGGFTRVNLNSIVDIVAPYKTGCFEELKGRIEIKDGLLITDNVVSTGENLNLYMAGSFNMANSHTSSIIIGKMPKKLSGKFGKLGQISIHSLIDIIPGIGYMPDNSEKPLIDTIPELNQIPGFGIGGGNHRYFMVNLKGDLYSEEYVNEFKWINPD